MVRWKFAAFVTIIGASLTSTALAYGGHDFDRTPLQHSTWLQCGGAGDWGRQANECGRLLENDKGLLRVESLHATARLANP